MPPIDHEYAGCVDCNQCHFWPNPDEPECLRPRAAHTAPARPSEEPRTHIYGYGEAADKFLFPNAEELAQERPDAARAEEWRPVECSNGDYEVSSLGRVRVWYTTQLWRRLATPRYLKPRLSKEGYLNIGVRIAKGVTKYKAVHRLVLEAFVGPEPAGKQAAHLNGHPLDNRLENLMWATRIENMSHCRLHGTLPIGTKNPSAKLTEELVKEIRARRAAGETQDSLAARYGVSGSTVWRATNGENWAHVQD